MFTVYRRVLGLCCAALLLSAAAAYGQKSGGSEVSFGYSYVRANAPPGECGCFNMNGVSGEFATGLGHGWSAVADLGVYRQHNIDGTGIPLWFGNYLFGPRLSYRHSPHWTPFAQFLVGGAHARSTMYGMTISSLGGTYTGSGAANGFALSAGGGLDWNATPHVAVRVFQIEYLNTRLPNSVNDTQNNLRLTFGVVYRFGKK
jgi:opacity protein-like surface antigen